jgi:Egg-laying hormone precursor
MKALVNIVFLLLVFLCNVESFTHHLSIGPLPPKSWIAASKLHAKEVRKRNAGEQREQESNNNKNQKKSPRSSSKLKPSSRRVKKENNHGKRKHISLETDNFDKIIAENAAFVDKTMFIKEWMEKKIKLAFFYVQGDSGKAQIYPC